MAKTLFTFILIVYLSNPVFTQRQQFIYSAFKHSNITLNGVAKIQTNGILQLTNYTPRSIGHAFYPYPIHLKNSTTGKSFSFSTTFVIAIVPEYEKLGGHGLAFTISASNEINSSLPSQYLGLLNASSNGNFSNHVFAVEFDTVQDFEFGDINDNHVGIDINSLVSNDSVPAGFFVEGNSSMQALKLKSGKRIQAWIDYDSMRNEVNVSLSLSSKKPSSSILSYRVDLSPVFNEYMYVGFSASTGLLASQHYLFGWSFSVNGEAQSLDLTNLPSLSGSRKNHTPLIVGVLISALVVTVISVTIYYLVRRMNRDVMEDWEFDTGPHRFSYTELKKATKGFRDKELLGFGGFGKVYKGILPNSGTEVAVKRISHESRQGLREFVSEIASIGRLRHRNLVQLLGWCRRRGDLLIVYDFMANGSLDKYIYENPRLVLNWEQRMKIVKCAASGLLYLHEEWEQIVIHRDIKAGNVLLDSDLNGKLGDFGLAKLYEHGSNPSTTRVVGTLGYLAPELTRTGKPTTSSDVFAFGALILEVVCGRRPVEAKAAPEELILVDWVWEMWKEGAVMRVVDRRLEGQFDENEVVLAVKLGLICSNDNPVARPSMRQVVRYLDGEVKLPDVVEPPGGGGDSGGLEDFVHSYPSSSAGGAADVEGGPDSALLLSEP